jgi:CRP-like cAMP-binding protein
MTTIELFRNATDGETFAAGATIFREGEPGDYMYVVQHGEVEVVAQDRVIERVGPGGIVGELALVDDGGRSATVLAATDCTLVPISRKRFLFLVQHTPHFALQVMSILAGRLRRWTAAQG